MSWAEIKYAINSTLGTNKFKPLNELIISEGKQLVASDTDFLRIDKTADVGGVGVTNANPSPEVTIVTIKPVVGGSVRMSVNLDLYKSATTSSRYTVAYVHVYINGVKKHTFSTSNSSLTGNVGTLNVELPGEFTFNAGDSIAFTLNVNSNSSATNETYSARANRIMLKANVVDKLVNIIE